MSAITTVFVPKQMLQGYSDLHLTLKSLCFLWFLSLKSLYPELQHQETLNHSGLQAKLKELHILRRLPTLEETGLGLALGFALTS